MSEPKWWIKEWPTEVGFYYSVAPDGYKHITECVKPGGGETKPDLMFYGPIPDPPKEPPKLRRFTATCKIGGRVSGVYVEGKEEPYYVTYFFAGSLCCGDRVESELSDIQWIDP